MQGLLELNEDYLGTLFTVCGCQGISAASPAILAASTTMLGGAAAPTASTLQAPGSLSLPAQYDVNDGRIRDTQLAQKSLDYLKASTAKFATEEGARAAGYHPNPSDPTHWINDQVFKTRNAYDLDHPASLIYQNGQLIGVMLSHNPSTGSPPDLGAGSWHTHPGVGDGEYALHVWFNKPLTSAFGHETGMV
jgi:hypothetical protein